MRIVNTALPFPAGVIALPELPSPMVGSASVEPAADWLVIPARLASCLPSSPEGSLAAS